MIEQNSSTARFLDRDIPEQYLQEWTAHIARAKDMVEAGAKSVVIFRLGAEWLALPTAVLQEIGEPPIVRTLPHPRGDIVKGLVSVRGELLLCMALEPLLGVESSGEIGGLANKERLLICRSKEGRFAFRVSEVEGTYRYQAKDLRNVPVTLSKTAGAYILGVLPRKDKAIGYLDHELLFYALNKGLA